MNTLKIIIMSIIPSILVCCVFWLGGWNFERGFLAGYMAVVSIVLGAIVATIASGIKS